MCGCVVEGDDVCGGGWYVVEGGVWWREVCGGGRCVVEGGMWCGGWYVVWRMLCGEGYRGCCVVVGGVGGGRCVVGVVERDDVWWV